MDFFFLFLTLSEIEDTEASFFAIWNLIVGQEQTQMLLKWNGW